MALQCPCVVNECFSLSKLATNYCLFNYHTEHSKHTVKIFAIFILTVKLLTFNFLPLLLISLHYFLYNSQSNYFAGTNKLLKMCGKTYKKTIIKKALLQISLLVVCKAHISDGIFWLKFWLALQLATLMISTMNEIILL